MITDSSSGFTPAFSGHETFALRSNWLKKAYDLLRDSPDLFYREDAFVSLGVGKNMAQSIRYWGRVCDIFVRSDTADRHTITWLGHALFDDDAGWDAFLVTPTSRWLLHWQIAARPQGAFTWYYTFNLLRQGEFTLSKLAQHICTYALEHDWKAPSEATINRDIACMLHCYLRPGAKQVSTAVEDALACPLSSLGLIRQLPTEQRYYLTRGSQPDLPDELVAYAVLEMLRGSNRQTIAFNDLAYAVCSPGRVFRLDEDALLERLLRIDVTTGGQAHYSEQAGIRQVGWNDTPDENAGRYLLSRAFDREVAL